MILKSGFNLLPDEEQNIHSRWPDPSCSGIGIVRVIDYASWSNNQVRNYGSIYGAKDVGIRCDSLVQVIEIASYITGKYQIRYCAIIGKDCN